MAAAVVLDFFAALSIDAKNIINKTRSIAPSTCPTEFPIIPITIRATVHIIENGKSFFIVSSLTSRAEKSAQLPRTTIRLKMFEPTTFPIAS